MTTLLLGLRLARAGGARRAGLILIGVAAGTVVLFFTAAVPTTLHHPDVDTVRLVVVVMIALIVPVVALLAAVVRLSAAVRDRRLASLRILGVSARATRTAAAVEAMTVAAGGVALGTVIFLLVRPLAEAADPAGQPWFHGRPLLPNLDGWIAVPLIVMAVCALVAVSPARAVTRAPIATRRQATSSPPSLWRLAPLTVGLICLGWVVVRSPQANVDRLAAPFFIGTILTALGLPLAVPVAIRQLTGLLIAKGTRPAVVLAARRAQQEPVAATRIVSTLIIALFVIIGARGVLVAFESTDQAVRAHHALTDGPQSASGPVHAGTRIDLAALRAVPGVRTVSSTGVVPLMCTRAQAAEFGSDAQSFGACSTAIVGTCADLPALEIRVPHCADNRLTWLITPGQHDPVDAASTRQRPVAISAFTSKGAVAATRNLPEVSHRVHMLPAPSDDPNFGFSGLDALLIPPNTPGVAALEDPAGRTVQALLDGGARPLRRFQSRCCRTRPARHQ